MDVDRYELWRGQVEKTLVEVTDSLLVSEIHKFFPRLLDPERYRNDVAAQYERSREDVLADARATVDQMSARLKLKECMSSLQSLLDSGADRKRRYEQAKSNNEEPSPLDCPYLDDEYSAREIIACTVADQVEERLDNVLQEAESVDKQTQEVDEQIQQIEAELVRLDEQIRETCVRVGSFEISEG